MGNSSNCACYALAKLALTAKFALTKFGIATFTLTKFALAEFALNKIALT